jgi:hypothetical protein
MEAIIPSNTKEQLMTSSTMTNTGVIPALERLQEFAETDPQAAQDAAWAWIQRLGKGLPGHTAEIELAQLFAAGSPADVDGQTAGVLLGWPAVDPALDVSGQIVRALAHTLTTRLGVMPWLGKKFDRGAQRGTNSVSLPGVLIIALLAPQYRMHRVGGHWEGFDMLNRVETSVVSPDTTVLVLDYETIGTNPWPVNRVRDEAVQIVPGVYLGAKLWHQGDHHSLLAYWAARSAEAV